MSRLIINPGSPAAWEIQLKPGTNLLGRGFANDFKLDDPSVSGSHCQIVLSAGGALIKDLGSTNGTYVNRAPVKEAVLQPGQTIHLGGVEILFQADEPAYASVAQSEASPRAMAIAPMAQATTRTYSRVAGPTVAPLEPPTHVPPEPPPLAPARVTGSQNCKFHPKTPGRYFCGKCQIFYCELCITSRHERGAARKFCRRCASEVVPVQVQTQSHGQKGFLPRLPGAFVYPFRGGGVFVLIVCTIVISALDFISAGWLSILSRIVLYGYLFSFMQNIIHSTAAGDEEMPGWPPFDSLFGCFFRLFACVLISFGAAIGFAIYAFLHEEPAAGMAMIPAMIFGCFYFPMALLAVAMKDSPLAANPLVVFPAIFKVPLEYLLTIILLGSVVILKALGDRLLPALFPKGLTTHSMAELFAMLASMGLWKFAVVSLLTIGMRILGLLYVTKKQKLGWFSH